MRQDDRVIPLPPERTPDKRKLKAVLKKGDHLIEVLELPDYGEVVLQMNNGKIARVRNVEDHKPPEH